MPASAAPELPRDLWMSSVGVQTTASTALGAADLDLLLAQRLRWTLREGAEEGLGLRALADARFGLDLISDETLETTNVPELGVRLDAPRVSLALGRHPVWFGGPRIVDGAEVLVRAGDAFEVGAWGGLAPDLFTTLPRLRVGGGPILAWTRSAGALSLVGEALAAEEGLDRVGVLATGRASAGRVLELFGRLDSELVGDDGPHLSDGLAAVTVRPATALRLDGFYNAFSTYRYLTTEQLDPDIQRFEARLLELAAEQGIVQDTLDPAIHHLFGGGARYLPVTDGAAPRLGLQARVRQGPDPELGFVRIHPEVGVVRLPVLGQLDVVLDGNAISVDDELQGDIGLTVAALPGDGAAAIDVGYRALVDPSDYDGALGHYVDGYFDVVLGTWLVGAGANAVHEPDPAVDDLGVGVLVRVVTYVRPDR